ncbi:MAG: methyl-accepting chemotaxis protein, partial [Halieaceae bacterium]|nr:methyl-accepting chemotaxis protein [Halieaceae bacterium]
QITGAMQQLDQVTQQNAAASEELAATAQEMRSQSQTLIEAVSFFRLAGQDSVARAAIESGADSKIALVSGSDVAPRPNKGMDTNVGAIDESQFERF